MSEAHFDFLSAARHIFAETPEAYRLNFAALGTSTFGWYPAPMGYCGSNAQTALVANVMRAVPFCSVRGGVIGQLGFAVNGGGAAGNARIAIYRSSEFLYPTTLVVQSGDVDVSGNGFKAIVNDAAAVPISVLLAPGELVWMVYNTSAAASVNIPASTINSHIPIFGVSGVTAMPSLSGWSVAQAFGAMPATFPAGAALADGGNLPLIVARFTTVGNV